jgi:hypothetical protein
MPTTENIDPVDELLAANIEPGPDQAPPLAQTLERIEATGGRRSARTRRVRRPRRTIVLAGVSAAAAVAASLAVVSGSSEQGGSAPLGVLQAAAATAKANPPSARFAGYVAETTVEIEGSSEVEPSTTRTWTIVRPVSDTEFEGQLVSLAPVPSPELKKRMREVEEANAKRGTPRPWTGGTVTTRREGDQVRHTVSWRRPYGTLFWGALAPGERPAPVPTDPQQARRAVNSWATGEPPAGEYSGLADLLRDSVGNGDRTQLALSYARMVLTAPRVAPDVRAAVYEALAEVPGVKIEPHATDRLGRPAAAIITETAHGPSLTRSELLIDPAAARVLAERHVFTVRPGANAHRPANEPPYSEGSQETTYRYQD